MKLWLLCACLLYYSNGVTITYEGNNMLTLLGQGNTSQTFKDFSKYWLLDKVFENRGKGLKVNINPLNDKIESFTLTGEIADLSEAKFSKYSGKLPLDINLEDDTAALCSKLGRGEKLAGRNTLRFHSDNLNIDATYNNLKTGKINYLTFSNTDGKPLIVADVAAAAVPQKLNKADKHHEQIAAIRNNALANHEQTNTAGAKPVEKNTAPATPFKKAILDVFYASRDSFFNAIKDGPREEGNFWKYKYTYNTKIKIPGEKYNMVYCFPFVTSQTDFVSVLKESEGYDKSFDVIYHEFERQLTQNFPPSEGWIASCLPAKDKNQLPDLEFRNDKYGAVILDHTRNPAGKHVLYLRFLLFAD